MAVIADDGFLPRVFTRRIHGHTPVWALVALAAMAYLLVAAGGLVLILEFSSLTFILVSFLMALANLRIRDKTDSRLSLTLAALLGLGGAGALLVYYQLATDPLHLGVTLALYVAIALSARLYAKLQARP
jgi:hypothetical protein